MPSSAWRSTLFPYTTLFRSDRKSTRLNSSHSQISYAVFCLKKKKAIIPALDKARKKGVLVIALDTPTDPQSAVDALFATDNMKAGELIGKYAKAAEGDKAVKIPTLDLAPGITVGALRHNGFTSGFGISNSDPRIVCQADTQGDQTKGQTAMENC